MHLVLKNIDFILVVHLSFIQKWVLFDFKKSIYQ